ncbi:MAG: GNAT family N-acetyltransferase [Endomicrobium sp.]|jgi:putative acetyltransferase|nr:GNAT family N-acetyltransferase [Endomicrobium sp.]
MEIIQLKEYDYTSVLDLWEKSVECSHEFLKEQDFNVIKESVEIIFKKIRLYGIKQDYNLCAFMGTSHNQIEALFVDPTYFGQGLGRRLVNYAINELNLRKVCVNEQNKKACNFYDKMGFKFVSRDKLDFLNLPYPVLHLELQR